MKVYLQIFEKFLFVENIISSEILFGRRGVFKFSLIVYISPKILMIGLEMKSWFEECKLI